MRENGNVLHSDGNIQLVQKLSTGGATVAGQKAMGVTSESPGLRFASHLLELRQNLAAVVRASTQPPLPEPGLAGRLSPPAAQGLYEIAAYIGDKWQIDAHSGLTFNRSRSFLGLKSQHVPSYLTAYNLTAGMYAALISREGSRPAALEYFYTASPIDPPPDFDVARAWVIQEFLKYYVVAGAFRAYGWHSFPGHVAGSYDDPTRLPYRAYPCGKRGGSHA